MGFHDNKYRTIPNQTENCPIFTRNENGLKGISVVIVSFNAPHFLQLCLESVSAALEGIDGEIIVVDNASNEECVPMIRSNFPEVRLIVNEENFGFSRASNQGAKVAEGTYLLILNPDVILPEESLKNALTYARAHPGMGALGCRFIDGSGKLLPECKRNLPGIQAATAKLFGLDRGYYATQLEEKDTGEVEILTGAFMFLKRELFQELGGFDESFFMFGEDIDLSYRILISGYKNRYLGDLTILHFKGESSAKDISYLKNFYGALKIFYVKHFRNNALGRVLLQGVVQGAILLRSLQAGNRGAPEKSLPDPEAPAIYLGDREEVYSALKENLGASLKGKALNLNEVSGTSAKRVFLDSSSLSFTQIIQAIELLPASISKRIVSGKGDFYLGSDSSTNRGVSEHLRQ